MLLTNAISKESTPNKPGFQSSRYRFLIGSVTFSRINIKNFPTLQDPLLVKHKTKTYKNAVKKLVEKLLLKIKILCFDGDMGRTRNQCCGTGTGTKP